MILKITPHFDNVNISTNPMPWKETHEITVLSSLRILKFYGLSSKDYLICNKPRDVVARRLNMKMVPSEETALRNAELKQKH